ncbi:MAG: thioredoxin family protein [Verrucomicrobiales bacterium]|nr:thioredoxin family protein [Verrucomicrobiales bacterium]
MKLIKKTLAVSAITLGILTASQQSSDAQEFSHDFEEASELAKKSQKPLIVVFSATWCPPCQKMKKSVYPSTEVKPYHDSFVWAYLDADESKNRPLMSKYGVNGIPHISFLSPGGNLVGHFAGAVSPEQFTKILDQVQNDIAKTGSNSGSQANTERKGSGIKR